MLEKILIGAAGAVAAVLILSAVSKFTDWIGVLFQPAVPDGAVVAFLHPCKDLNGWEDYADGAGKFLLGVGNGVLRPQGPHRPSVENSEITLSEIKFGDQGGEEAHTLRMDEMPKHQHRIIEMEWGHTINGNGHPARIDVDDGGPWRNTTGYLTTETKGSDYPHNNMPPYIALYFCEKA